MAISSASFSSCGGSREGAAQQRTPAKDCGTCVTRSFPEKQRKPWGVNSRITSVLKWPPHPLLDASVISRAAAQQVSARYNQILANGVYTSIEYVDNAEQKTYRSLGTAPTDRKHPTRR
jgi:hypothetical protein